jgi:2-oxoglutarate ferredoxin oxidoreductase subunit beta
MSPETTPTAPVKYQKKDFATDQEVRWCPGCGDYAILNAVQIAFANLGIPREKFVVVSGIGCSSRLPYYVNTYGFHSIHGRAPAIATGVKIANPELQVWVGTGDGDALSIGGNHILHSMRRNADIKVLLFNNRIYGLTKGQYSPTSELGKINKSAPFGTVDRPINPISIALASGATFIARSVDIYAKHLQDIITRAAKHKGAAFIEIFQNCNVFNDGAFDSFTTREVRDDSNVALEHGKPLVFGKNRDRGLRLKNNFEVEVVTLGKDGVTEKDLIIHDEKNAHSSYAYLISRLTPPEFPMPIGVFRDVGMPSLDQRIHEQIAAARQKLGEGDLEKLLHSGDTWIVK